MAKNYIVTVGWTGNKRAYLNVPTNKAVRRYIDSEYGNDGLSPKEMKKHFESYKDTARKFDFDDEFGCYDAWGNQ